VVKPAEDRPRYNPTNSLNRTWDWRVFAQRQVRAHRVVIVQVRKQNVRKVSLTEHDKMVNAFPSDRADQPFGIGILPWGSRRYRPILGAHRN